MKTAADIIMEDSEAVVVATGTLELNTELIGKIPNIKISYNPVTPAMLARLKAKYLDPQPTYEREPIVEVEVDPTLAEAVHRWLNDKA